MEKLNLTQASDPKEGFIVIDVPIRIPIKAYEKLVSYGYNFQNNFEDYARRTYFELIYCEEIEDEKKKAKAKRQTKKKTES